MTSRCQRMGLHEWDSMDRAWWMPTDSDGRDKWSSRRRRISSPRLVCCFLNYPVLWLLIVCFLSDYGRQRTPNDITHHHPDGKCDSRQRGSLAVDGAQGSMDGARPCLEPPPGTFFFNYFLFLVLLIDYLLSDYYRWQQIPTSHTNTRRANRAQDNRLGSTSRTWWMGLTMQIK